MSTELIQAIDVHGHYGLYLREGLSRETADFMTGDADVIVQRAQRAHIAQTIVSPLEALLPRHHGNPVSGNRNAAATVAQTEGLLQYVVIDPQNQETLAQAADLLQLPKCVGIKIHPEEHGYPIARYARVIFEFAARHRAVVLTHSSDENSEAAEFVPFANDYPEVKLILAHIGCGWDGDMTHQVRAIHRCQHGNVFADTSSARSITPGLIEWAVKEVGAERVLFGSDTPLYHVSMQRVRIDHADLTDHQKQLILRDNALNLFGLRELL